VDDQAVARVLAHQDGVIARRQLLTAGGSNGDVERMVRRKELIRVLPAVFVDHTGPLTWLQQAWAGVLFRWPAALAGNSALRAAIGPGWRRHDDRDPIVLAVRRERNVSAPPGYRITRPTDFDRRVQWNASPPRLRVEEAAIDEAARQARELQVIGVLADVCQARVSTPSRLRESLLARGRVPRRKWLLGVLDDVASGSCSVLEHGYLTLVERAHGMPRPERQPVEQSSRGRVRRDVLHEEYQLIIELDGRLFHDRAEVRDADLDRDLDAAVDGRISIRLGWGQVFDRPCLTALRVAALLRRGGWTGQLRPCSPDCPVRRALP
jgi:hypothetical protein